MAEQEPRFDGFVPGRHLLDAYGNGGFRFAEMSHRGSILALPSGIHKWDVTVPSDLTRDALTIVLEQAQEIELLLIGMGTMPMPLAADLREMLKQAGVSVDTMTTGSAARTYNVLAGEQRKVAAALIAV